jgi:hypothetical protein
MLPLLIDASASGVLEPVEISILPVACNADAERIETSPPACSLEDPDWIKIPPPVLTLLLPAIMRT